MVRKRRTGKPPIWYVYAYRGGPCVLRKESDRRPTLGPAELRAIGDVLDQLQQRETATLRSLIRQWRSCDPKRLSSPEWERLAPNTKKTWGSALDTIEAKWAIRPYRFGMT